MMADIDNEFSEIDDLLKDVESLTQLNGEPNGQPTDATMPNEDDDMEDQI